jgi:hypothetical protein
VKTCYCVVQFFGQLQTHPGHIAVVNYLVLNTTGRVEQLAIAGNQCNQMCSGDVCFCYLLISTKILCFGFDFQLPFKLWYITGVTVFTVFPCIYDGT